MGDLNRLDEVALGPSVEDLPGESARPATAPMDGRELTAGAEVTGAAANMAGSDFAKTFMADGNFEGLIGFGLVDGVGPAALGGAEATALGATDATFVATGSSKSQLSSTESIRAEPLAAGCPDSDAAGARLPVLLEPGAPRP